MPITLSCPTCAKKFRARDESAGKRVKCPYCQAAIVVSADGATADPPADPGPMVPSQPRFQPSPPGPARPAPVAPGDWGNEPPLGGPKSAPIPAPAPRGFTGAPAAPAPRPAPAPRSSPSLPKPRKEPSAEPRDAKTPNQLALPGWKKTKSGLFWVLAGLVFLALPGFVEFGKLVYERSVGDLPKGDGWIKIDGYVNSKELDSVTLSKTEEINIIAYGVPLVLGGLMLAFGRLTAGAAPRASGAKGLFTFSGLFTLLGLVSLVTFAACVKLRFEQVAGYTLLGFLVGCGLAEVWFLTGLATAGAHLKRPGVARSVGFLWFVVALLVVTGTVGWEQYVKEVRPKPVNNEVDKESLLYEAGAKMLGWLMLIGCYWRTVRVTRGAIRDFTDSVE